MNQYTFDNGTTVKVGGEYYFSTSAKTYVLKSIEIIDTDIKRCVRLNSECGYEHNVKFNGDYYYNWDHKIMSKKKLQLEVGKIYLDSDNIKVEIVAHKLDDVGEDLYLGWYVGGILSVPYTNEGKSNQYGNLIREYNPIEELRNLKKDDIVKIKDVGYRYVKEVIEAGVVTYNYGASSVTISDQNKCSTHPFDTVSLK